MTNATIAPRLAKMSDAVQYTSFSRSTIYRAIEAGDLVPLKFGHAIRFEYPELDRWIDVKSNNTH